MHHHVIGITGDQFLDIMNKCGIVLTLQFDIFGTTVTLWQLFLFGCLVYGITFWIISTFNG